MYGWYAGTAYSSCVFIDGYEFDYCPYGGIPNTAHCTDGNVTDGPFWAPGPGMVASIWSRGGYDGAHCVFGWWDPGFTPFIYGNGFYIRPNCMI